jgi:hypothetical protein
VCCSPRSGSGLVLVFVCCFQYALIHNGSCRQEILWACAPAVYKSQFWFQHVLVQCISQHNVIGRIVPLIGDKLVRIAAGGDDKFLMLLTGF